MDIEKACELCNHMLINVEEQDLMEYKLKIDSYSKYLDIP